MTRDKAVGIIELLYPADSEYLEVRQLGEKLLYQAKCEVQYDPPWRDEHTPVLVRYAELCEAKSESSSSLVE